LQNKKQLWTERRAEGHARALFPLRMALDLQHFENLQRLLRLERGAARAREAEEREALTQQEREARGLSASGLEAVEESVGLGGRFIVTLQRPDGSALPARLSSGDVVVAHPRATEDVVPTRGVVVRGSRTRVEVAFDRPPPAFVRNGRVVLDVVPDDVTFERASAAVAEVAALERGSGRRLRDLLLGLRPPEFEAPKALSHAGTFLNEEQQEAARLALAARDVFCVQGPPGTGKSTVLAAVAAQWVRASGGPLLCTAASNAAVDHLVSLCLQAGLRAVRIGHPARVGEGVQHVVLDVLVEAHPDRQLARQLYDEAFALQGHARKQRTRGRSRERFANARTAQAEARTLLAEARALERKAVDAVLGRAEVLCATLTALGTPPLSRMHFPLALVDEATQATEPLTLLAFLRADRVVLAGDHRQLAPTVLSQDAAQGGLGRSLFERLVQTHGADGYRMLREQYRMNDALMSLISEDFYGGLLRAHPSVAKRTLADVLTAGADIDAPPFLFLDTAGKGFEEAQEAKAESYDNPGEALLVVSRVHALLAAGLPPEGLAVITPYRGQAVRLQAALEGTGVEVDTVDAFQGREADAVLASCVRSNPDGRVGFLQDLRRMNVALSRARRHLFLVGDSATLGHHPFYRQLVERSQAAGGYRSAWEWPLDSREKPLTGDKNPA
jgi:ATP-dependent RNA/DNA helicase IGHMBP2